MKRTTAIAVSLLLPALVASAQTDIYLSTERSGRGLIPIVVDEIRPAGPGSERTAEYITKVVRSDLALSGIFEPLAFDAGSDTLSGGGTAAVIFAGSIDREGEDYVLEGRLLDYGSREVIFNRRYRFQQSARRVVAHRIADAITYFLIGERGIATTRLIFRRATEGEAKDLFVVDYDGHGERRLTTGELTLAPRWLDDRRFCHTSYRRGNPDCYLVDLRAGKRTLISHREGSNVPGGYFPEAGEILITLSVDSNNEIFVINPSGEIVRRLTRNRAIDCSATWSSTGREIAFVSDRTGTPQVYIMDGFGGNLRRLTRNGSYNTSPAWSPRGDLIAYVSRDGWQYRLKLISPDGLYEETLFEDYLSYEEPTWAPDGRHLATTVRYGGEPWIVVIDAETGGKRRLVQGDSPAWSPLSPENE